MTLLPFADSDARKLPERDTVNVSRALTPDAWGTENRCSTPSGPFTNDSCTSCSW